MAETKKRKNIIIAIAVVAVLVTAVLVLAALYMSAKAQEESLNNEMNANDTELYIRRFASDTRLKRVQDEEKKYEDELNLRKELRENMIENDREYLLTLVNPWNELDSETKIRTVKIGRRGEDEEMFYDERAAAALVRMIEDCEAAGCRPVVISAYRTHEYQQKLFDDKVQREIESGVDYELAPESAAKSVAKPGTSEHELGLAVDIIDDFNRELDITQEWTDTQRWLMSHCIEYGFILRYPNNTTDTTGIIYEPWHYRYIGKENAKNYELSGAATFEDYLAGR